MIFFNKYKIDLDISRYDALKLLLDNFHQLGSDSDCFTAPAKTVCSISKQSGLPRQHILMFRLACFQ